MLEFLCYKCGWVCLFDNKMLILFLGNEVDNMIELNLDGGVGILVIS